MEGKVEGKKREWENSPRVQSYEHWRELGYERGGEDGVDEAALFLVFRPYRVV